MLFGEGGCRDAREGSVVNTCRRLATVWCLEMSLRRGEVHGVVSSRMLEVFVVAMLIYALLTRTRLETNGGIIRCD